jgi:integrase
VGHDDRFQWDSDIPGFALRTRRMKKWGKDTLSNQPPRETWIFCYGRNRKITIGQASALKPEAARQIAAKHYAKVLQGIDPHVEKQTNIAKSADTLGGLIQKHLETQRGQLRPGSYRAVERYLNKHAAPLHRLPLESVDRKAIAGMLANVERTSGAVSANRARDALSACFHWGMREGLATANPVALTNKRAEQERERILSDDELRIIWNTLPPNEYGVICKLLLLTGARLNEIAQLRWSEIDFAKGVITLPGARTKNAKAHEIPLSPTAKALLASLPRNGRETLFKSLGPGRRKVALDAAITRANGQPIAHWTHHDFRRTAATGMVEIGILPNVVEAILNHVSGHKRGVAGIYNRYKYGPEKADALNRWDAHVAKLVA